MPLLSIKSLREEKGLTRADVFKATGIIETTQRNAELNQNSMSIPTMVALANFYNVTLDEIIDRSRTDNRK